MGATAYDDSKTYLPFRKKKKKDGGCGCGKKKHEDHDHGCGCEECKCGCEEEKKDCGCCPAGLVSVFDDEDKFIGCLTPNDAELYMKRTLECESGKAKLFNAAGDFLGCVSAADFVDLYPIVNP
jgi:hypothetical protein